MPWEYPDWALIESFSPTTGDDLQLVKPAIRTQLEQVQRVEFASSPPTGGPINTCACGIIRMNEPLSEMICPCWRMVEKERKINL